MFDKQKLIEENDRLKKEIEVLKDRIEVEKFKQIEKEKINKEQNILKNCKNKGPIFIECDQNALRWAIEALDKTETQSEDGFPTISTFCSIKIGECGEKFGLWVKVNRISSQENSPSKDCEKLQNKFKKAYRMV